MSRYKCPSLIISFIIISVQIHSSQAQSNSNPATVRFSKLDSANAARAYQGIITSKGKQDGLFPVKSTGVSTLPIMRAAEVFLKSLDAEQALKTQFDVDSKEWQAWSNVDNGIYKRKGISIKEMSQEQRKLAFQLMQEALSAKALQLSKDIMKTDQTLKELNNGSPRYDEELYFFTVMGKPSMTEPWGWQIDGHHLAINYFILGDQVVMTPAFMGGEPIITTTGKYQGNSLFQDEQNIGLKFMQSLSAEQQKQATLAEIKGRNNIAAEAFSDNKTLDYQGLQASEMSAAQKQGLISLVNQYISNMAEGHARVKMDDIQKHLEHTWFGWIGSTDQNAAFYYRIHSPVVLIEFDHQAPVGVQGGGRNAVRNHIHTMVRTPNGNDYGKDLLKEHLKTHHQHQ